MTTTSPLYRKAVIIGATSGIGESLAARLVSLGTKVIVTGRRQARLDAFVAQHGSSNVSAAALDVLDLASIPRVARTLIAQHPDIDCVVINAGIQRPFDFTKPETVDFLALHDEITTNYTAAVHASMAFLPHLQSQQIHRTSIQPAIVYISATLGLVPTMLRTANYNATKAALHHFILAFREQLKRAAISGGLSASSTVKLVEVFPPAVQTELHDERHQPDLRDGGTIGMPLEKFTDALVEGLRKGEDQFAVGPGQTLLEGFEAERNKAFLAQVDTVEALLSKFRK